MERFQQTVINEMVIGHAPPIKRRKYQMADTRMKALVKKAVEEWQEIVPMDYLSGIASNFRMAQGLTSFGERNYSNIAKVVVFDTKFYLKLSLSGVRAVLGWTRHEDIFEQDILLIPIHLPGHWALVAVKIKKHRLIYYDSLLGDGHICLSLIKKYLEQESMQKGHHEKDPVNWLGFNDKTIPQQSNCYDCGIFVCLFAESVSRDARPDFKQQQVKEIRRRISKKSLMESCLNQRKLMNLL
uniref:Ubiquitin-like protease family profile domain-containing protein n=1 Tax=Ditylenchus dipsaci TaxID=166011 RepID=A0A915D935_9BILA